MSQLTEIVGEMERRRHDADYIFSEIESYMTNEAKRINEHTFTLEVDFMNWCLRRIKKYQEGETK
jgi:hypothetical protein